MVHASYVFQTSVSPSAQIPGTLFHYSHHCRQNTRHRIVRHLFWKPLSRNCLVCLSILFLTSPAYAQTHTQTQQQPQTHQEEILPRNPVVAGLLSGILPGAGQIYNGQWWKAPIVWIGEGALLYLSWYTYQQYTAYVDLYQRSQTGDVPYPPEVLQSYVLYWRRWLEWSLLTTALFYLIQIADAVVYAHLSGFDVAPIATTQYLPLPSTERGVASPSSFPTHYFLTLGWRFTWQFSRATRPIPPF